MRIAQNLPIACVLAGVFSSLTPAAFAAIAVTASNTDPIDFAGIIGGTIFLATPFVFYFMPALVAAIRKHNNVLPIFMVNLLLGWTIFGWIIPLIWACTSDVKGRRCCKTSTTSLPTQAPGEGDPEYLMRLKRLYAA